LNHYTQKLPLVESDGSIEAYGDTTINAIKSGVMFGTLMEMQGFINHYQEKYPELKTILTGGDHSYFANRLKGTIFAESDLVLKD